MIIHVGAQPLSFPDCSSWCCNKHHHQIQLEEERGYLAHTSRSQSIPEGIQGRTFKLHKQKPLRKLPTAALPLSCSASFLLKPWPSCLWGWWSTHTYQSSVKTIPLRYVRRTNWCKPFFRWHSIFPGDLSLYQADNKNDKHTGAI